MRCGVTNDGWWRCAHRFLGGKHGQAGSSRGTLTTLMNVLESHAPMDQAWKRLCETNAGGEVAPWLQGMREQGVLTEALVEACWAQALEAQAVWVCSALYQGRQWLPDSPATRALFEAEVVKPNSAAQGRWSKGCFEAFVASMAVVSDTQAHALVQQGLAIEGLKNALVRHAWTPSPETLLACVEALGAMIAQNKAEVLSNTWMNDGVSASCARARL